MSGPLEGVRIFDCTLFMVGPWATMELGAMGADVIRVEEPDSVQGARIALPPYKQGTSVGYIVWNMNKRCMLLDLKQEADRDIAYRVLETCDVFVENMRPGAADRLGMAYETVSRVNPRIVYVSAAGYGQKGPLRHMAASDTILQGFTGWSSINGSPGGTYEHYRHHTQLDASAGNYVACAILLGLLARNRTGKAQRVDVSMFHASVALQTTRLAEFLATGKNPPLKGSACVNVVPHQAFLCQDRTYIAVGVVAESQWAPLCRVLGLPALIDDARFATNRVRVEHEGELVPVLEKAFLAKPRYYWILQLSQEGVPCGKFTDWDELRYHPQVTENNHVIEMETPWGRVHTGGPPWKFSETPASMRPAPIPGEHTHSIQQELGRPPQSPGQPAKG